MVRCVHRWLVLAARFCFSTDSRSGEAALSQLSSRSSRSSTVCDVRYADAFHHNDVDRPFDRSSSQWPDVADRRAEQVQAAHHYQQQRADRAVRASQRSTKRTHFARRRSTDARRLAQRRQSRAYVFHCAIYDISRHFQWISMVKLFKLKILYIKDIYNRICIQSLAMLSIANSRRTATGWRRSTSKKMPITQQQALCCNEFRYQSSWLL